jgi:Flp pilus assembly protein TadB
MTLIESVAFVAVLTLIVIACSFILEHTHRELRIYDRAMRIKNAEFVRRGKELARRKEKHENQRIGNRNKGLERSRQRQGEAISNETQPEAYKPLLQANG